MGDWTAPENAAKMMFWIVKWEKSKRATYLIDDISLRPVDSTTSILKNGSFRSGAESTGWGHTKSVEFVPGYGVGAGEAAVQYQILAQEPMYRSAVYRHSLEQKQYPIRSRLLRMNVSGPDEITLHPLRELYLVEDTTLPIPLFLSSSHPDSIEEVNVSFTLPDCCHIINPGQGRQTIAPESISKNAGPGDNLHTCRLTFSSDAVAPAWAADHEVIPIPLFFRVSGSDPAKSEYEVGYHAETGGGETEDETVLPLHILPPLSGARPSSLPIEAHFTGKIGRYSLLEKAQWVRTWGLAGFNHARVGYPAGDEINEFKRKRITGTHDWQKVEIQAPLPDGALNYRVLLGANGKGIAWHDDIHVRVE